MYGQFTVLKSSTTFFPAPSPADLLEVEKSLSVCLQKNVVEQGEVHIKTESREGWVGAKANRTANKMTRRI